ncbi:hypothetical protein ACIP10_36405 [Streptomyces galbus]|uniref:hypothetical protein n=1 Tax=Streptomyces galbus TaxID=33898 RepID=UPI0037F5C513
MPFLAGRGGKIRLAPELDDEALGQLLKSLLSTTRTGTIATAGLGAAQISSLMVQGTSWDRYTHRMSVLAEFLSGSDMSLAWARREPHNGSALALHAWTQLMEGRSRGHLADVAAVTESCFEAADLAPADPIPWLVLFGIARLERWERSKAFEMWNEVVARDRWNREAYLGMLSYLMPEEAGSHVQAMDFIDSLSAHMPENAACAATELFAHLLHYHSLLSRGGIDALVARDYWSQASAAQALDRAVRDWVKPNFHHAAALADLNLLAYALMAASRRHEARPVFEKLRGKVTLWPWCVGGDSLIEFEQAWSKASR